MSKVITFSRFFPATHPRRGEQTFFVEKIWRHFLEKNSPMFPYWMKNHECGVSIRDSYDYGAKYHTIRVGNRWKVGDKFSPRIWGDDVNPKSGRKGAYQSKQMEIAPLIEIKKIWEFKITKDKYFLNSKELDIFDLSEIAANDGLGIDDFELWFAPYTKKGDCVCQIICWDENINY